MADQIIELKARVTSYPKNNTFNVLAVNSQQTFTLECPFFCPVQINDAIYAKCKKINGNNLRIISPPFVIPPLDKDSIINGFLKALYGTSFGNFRAVKLYEKFQEEAYDKDVSSYISNLAKLRSSKNMELLHHPYKGIVDMKQFYKLLEWWEKQRDLRQLYLLGLNNKEIKECRLPYEDIYKQCLDNPFVLPSIPIPKCLEILSRLNKSENPKDVLCGSLIRFLYNNLYQRDWSGTPSYIVLRQFPDFNKDKTLVTYLKEKYPIVTEEGLIYLQYPWHVEKTVSQKLASLFKNISIYSVDTDVKFFDKNLDDEQQNAVKTALFNNISIITGGAGTGKTTLIKELANQLEFNNIQYRIASFTGKAVSRIQQVIGKRSPSTLHKLISDGSKELKKSANGKISLDKDDIFYFEHLILDEASMITTELLYQFLETFPWNFKITFVGDINQLPPIGWGNLMKSLLETKIVPVVRLVKNHRVASGDYSDGIIKNASNILCAIDDEDFDFCVTDNFQLISGDLTSVKSFIEMFKESGISSNDISVITPYNSDVEIINNYFQSIYNIEKEYIEDTRGIRWYIDDRVMMTTNNYDINIMNGEEGSVIEIIKEEKTIVVKFENSTVVSFSIEIPDVDLEQKTPNKFKKVAISSTFDSRRHHEDKEIDIPYETLESSGKMKTKLSTIFLVHCFCITCHKSQGSEWPFIIAYIPSSEKNTNFLDRNLVYTMVTRARKGIWCIGDIDAFRSACLKQSKFKYEELTSRFNKIMSEK